MDMFILANLLPDYLFHVVPLLIKNINLNDDRKHFSFFFSFLKFLLDFLKPYSRRLTKTYHDFPLHTMLTRCDIWCILYGKSIFFLFTTKNNFLKFTFIEKMKE